MVTIKTNINQVVQVLITKLENLKDNDIMLRNCAQGALGAMKVRIHKDGKAADGSQIGTYSEGYMTIRTGSFANAKRVSRGPNVGKLKDAGVFTKKGTTVFTQQDEETVTSKKAFVNIAFQAKARPQYHRDNDTKVIASLTRQMENDEKVIAIRSGAYGIGFTNKLNYDKSRWVEAKYRKTIYALTEEEEALVLSIANKYVNEILHR